MTAGLLTFNAINREEYESRLSMARLMALRSLDRLEGYSVNVTDRFPAIRSLTSLTFIGSFAWTQSTIKHRYMLSTHTYQIGVPLSPADIARDYLYVKYRDTYRMRCRTSQYKNLVRDIRSAPLYVSPGYLHDAVYIDLKSAYWQILQTIGWMPEYLPGQYLGKKDDVNDFPYEQIKLSRNSLVSVALAGRSRVWTGTKFATFKRRSMWMNLVLWGAVQDVLHGIAADMIEYADARYVHTDGYIIPAKNLKKAYSIARAWGMLILIKHSGWAKIRNVGDYDMPDRKSGKVTRFRRTPYSNIRQQDRDWLRQRIRRLADSVHLRDNMRYRAENEADFRPDIVEHYLTKHGNVLE